MATVSIHTMQIFHATVAKLLQCGHEQREHEQRELEQRGCINQWFWQ